MELKILVNGKLNNLLFFVFILLLSSCSYDYEGYPINGQAYVISVSSDGNYAVTSNSNKKIILWDIKNQTSKIISENANIYSAYFIKNSDMFIWQDLKDIVHVQNVFGKEILSFHSFPSYGQVMTSDLKHYFASNDNLDLYGDYGKNQHLILTNGNQGGFIGAEKLINLTLSSDNQFLLTSGWGGDYQVLEFDKDDGIVLWNVNNERPIRRFLGNVAKAIATISPNNRYIVSGDEDGRTFISNSFSGDRLLKLDNNSYGQIVCGKSSCFTDMAGYPPVPKILYNAYGSPSGHGDQILNLKFIDLNNDYLHFTAATNYAVLYQVTKSKPLKYLSLGHYPWPVSRMPFYSRDEAIDTAPAANILVMAQADGPGIIVYKFDPKTLTLHKIWAPGADLPHFIKVGTLNFLIGLFLCLVGNLKKYPTLEKTTAGIAVSILLFSIFPLYVFGFSAGLVGIIISIIVNHFLNFPTISMKKIRLINS